LRRGLLAGYAEDWPPRRGRRRVDRVCGAADRACADGARPRPI